MSLWATNNKALECGGASALLTVSRGSFGRNGRIGLVEGVGTVLYTLGSLADYEVQSDEGVGNRADDRGWE